MQKTDSFQMPAPAGMLISRGKQHMLCSDLDGNLRSNFQFTSFPNNLVFWTFFFLLITSESSWFYGHSFFSKKGGNAESSPGHGKPLNTGCVFRVPSDWWLRTLFHTSTAAQCETYDLCYQPMHMVIQQVKTYLFFPLIK